MLQFYFILEEINAALVEHKTLFIFLNYVLNSIVYLMLVVLDKHSGQHICIALWPLNEQINLNSKPHRLNHSPIYWGVPPKLLYSSPWMKRWAMPKSMILMSGMGACLSDNMIFSGWRTKKEDKNMPFALYTTQVYLFLLYIMCLVYLAVHV